MRPNLTVIIVSWNTAELTRQCLKSVDRNVGDFNTQIVVVDNASTDSSVDMVKKEFPQAEVIENEANVGFAKANNIALKYLFAKASPVDFIVFLNSDVVLSEGSLSDMLFALTRSGNVAAGSPALVLPDGKYQTGAAGYELTIKSVFIYSFFLHKILPRKYAKGMYLDQRKYMKTSDAVLVDWISGACFCIKADIVRKIGFWDESSFMYAEDVEYCERIRRSGREIIYVPSVKVIHHHGASSKGEKKTNVSWIYASLSHVKSSRTNYEYVLIRSMLTAGMLLRMILYFLIYLKKKTPEARNKLKDTAGYFKAYLTSKI